MKWGLIYMNDLDYLLYCLKNSSDISPCVVNYQGHLCKIKKANYVPDTEGKIHFRAETLWSNAGMSVAELQELITLFWKDIVDVDFETFDNNVEHLVNIRDFEGIDSRIYCIIYVGDGGESLTKYNNL